MRKKFEDWIEDVKKEEGKIEEINGFWWVTFDVRGSCKSYPVLLKEYAERLNSSKGQEQ